MSKEEQLLIAEKIEQNYRCKIIKSENEPYVLFKTKDIGNILELSNVLKVVNRYSTIIEKQKIKTETNGGIQNSGFLTYRGLMKLLSRTRKSNIIEFSTKIGIDLYTQIFTCIEMDTIKCIMDSFNNEQMIKQYAVKTYRIDLFFPEYKLAIECDELHHNTLQNKINDTNREEDIKKEIENCTFIRYEPFAEKFNIFILINQIHTFIKKFDKAQIDNICMNRNIESNFTIEQINTIREKRAFTAEMEQKTLEMQQKTLEMKQKMVELEIQLADKLASIKPDETPLENTFQEKQEDTIPAIKTRFLKRRLHSRSPKVYQFNPETLELVNIYDSIIDVLRKFENASASALKVSAKENTVYKQFRWVLQDRDIEEVPIPTSTIYSRTQSVEYIAMIDVKRTKILEVFPSQKEAAQARNLAGFSTISRAIKQNSLSSGHYWNIFHKCSQEMQDEYLKTNTLPEKHIKANGVTVTQIDPLTDKEIKTFSSITEVTLNHQMSRTTLKKVSDSNEVHNGYKWKITIA